MQCNSAVQGQKAVTADFLSEQLLPFEFPFALSIILAF